MFSTLLADIRNREIEAGRQLEEREVLDVVARAIKIRSEAAEQMSSRPERAEAELREVEILREYMPPQLSEEEIRQRVVAAIEAGAADIGAVMGRVMPELKGRADGREVNLIAREEIESRRSGT